jgi:hypothetical protein
MLGRPQNRWLSRLMFMWLLPVGAVLMVLEWGGCVDLGITHQRAPRTAPAHAPAASDSLP